MNETVYGLCMDFPLRDGFMAQIVIPRDMTTREAERLSAFIHALTIDEATQETSDPR